MTQFFKKTFINKGIGPWTIEMFLLFVCHKPDIFSIGDIALLNSVRINYSVETLDEIKSISLKWEPYRSVASLLLWKSIENKIFYKKRDNHIKDYPFRTRGDLNPHEHYCSLDFKSNVSTNSTTRAKNSSERRDLNPRPSPWQGDALP